LDHVVNHIKDVSEYVKNDKDLKAHSKQAM